VTGARPGAAPSAKAAAGFTLIELLVAIAIAAVLLRIAMPGMSSVMLSVQLSSYANSFTSTVQSARSEAISRNGFVTVCRSTSGTSCASSGDFQQGWILFVDVNGNGSVETGDTILRKQGALSSDYRFTSSAYSLVFQPSGVGSTSATLVLCRSEPAGEQRRDLSVTSTGRVNVSTVRNTTCP
jgi:type IV fimbrial biogenesis protein FimT